MQIIENQSMRITSSKMWKSSRNASSVLLRKEIDPSDSINDVDRRDNERVAR
jgi:hypothetical protein